MNAKCKSMMKRKGHDVFEVVQKVIQNFLNNGDEQKREEFSKFIHEEGLLNNASQLEDADQIKSWLTAPSRFSSHKGYSDFQKYTYRSKNIHLWRFVRIAVSVMIPILLVVGAYQIFTGQGEENPMAHTITPISSKAYIRMDNGERVGLGLDTGYMVETDGTKIIREKNKVMYTNAGNSAQEEVVYNELIVPRGGEYMLILSDSSKIWINAGSRLKYPVCFKGNNREVYLLEGEAYFDVTKNEDKPFWVFTSRGSVKVLGTEFNVRDYSDEDQVVTTLVNGSIQYMDDVDADKREILQPGYQIVVNKEMEEWQIRKVNMNEFTAWKDGLYVFNNLTLEELMKTVERNYDVTVFFANEACKSLRFSGDLQKYENVEYFLRYIETGGDVRFMVKDRIITIYKK